MNFKPSSSLLVTVAAVTMALASLAASVWLSHGLQSRILQVQETTALRRQFFLLAAALREAEAAQRFYVITGDPAHAAPVDSLISAMPERWTALKEAAATTPLSSINRSIPELEVKVAEALSSLSETMAIREQQGREPAISLVQSAGNYGKLTAVHEKLGVIMEQLEQQLQDQSGKMMRAERLGHTGSLAAGLVALALAGLGVWQWRRALQHRQREQELAAGRSRAQQMAKDKGDFLAAMSHEVRTPLTAMLGLSESLRDSLPQGSQQEKAAAVHSAAQGLLRLVNDLLDLSRMDAGRMQLSSESVHLADFATGVETLLATKAALAGISLDVSVDKALPSSILIDPVRLRQIVLNLATNALKFTEAGGFIRLRLEFERGAAGEMLVLEVKDNGSGIPASLQKAIFEPYVQGHLPSLTGESGTGLGLAIVRQLVKLMDGALSLQSQPGEGSTFRVTIPLVTHGTSAPSPDQRDEPEANRSLAPTLPTTILSKSSAERLQRLLKTHLPAAQATLGTVEVASLVRELEIIAAEAPAPELNSTVIEIRQAADSFAISNLVTLLKRLPDRLEPLFPPDFRL